MKAFHVLLYSICLSLLILSSVTAADRNLLTTTKESRVVGGNVADPVRYPYFVYLFISTTNQGVYECGGILLFYDLLLSAAHCVEGLDVTGITAVVNMTTYFNPLLDLDLDDDGPTGYEQIRSVVDYRQHPLFNPATVANDVMLLRLDKPVFNVDFPLLPNGASFEQIMTAGEPVTVIGFGRTTENGGFPTNLMNVDLEIVSHEDCNDENSYNGEIDNDVMICASLVGRVRYVWCSVVAAVYVSYTALHAFLTHHTYLCFCGIYILLSPQQDACQGDSGGPLILKPSSDDDNNHSGVNDVIIGLVSFGSGCAQDDYPGVYSRLSAVTDFIMGEGFCQMATFATPTISDCAAYSNTGITTNDDDDDDEGAQVEVNDSAVGNEREIGDDIDSSEVGVVNSGGGGNEPDLPPPHTDDPPPPPPHEVGVVNSGGEDANEPDLPPPPHFDNDDDPPPPPPHEDNNGNNGNGGPPARDKSLSSSGEDAKKPPPPPPPQLQFSGPPQKLTTTTTGNSKGGGATAKKNNAGMGMMGGGGKMRSLLLETTKVLKHNTSSRNSNSVLSRLRGTTTNSKQ